MWPVLTLSFLCRFARTSAAISTRSPSYSRCTVLSAIFSRVSARNLSHKMSSQQFSVVERGAPNSFDYRIYFRKFVHTKHIGEHVLPFLKMILIRMLQIQI
jgi:hypothetical protein